MNLLSRRIKFVCQYLNLETIIFLRQQSIFHERILRTIVGCIKLVLKIYLNCTIRDKKGAEARMNGSILPSPLRFSFTIIMQIYE